MPATAVSKKAMSLTRTGTVLEREFVDRFHLVGEEIRPDQIRSRLALASLGQIGPLQEVYQMMDTDARNRGINIALGAAIGRCPLKVSPPKKKSRAATTATELLREQFRRVNNVRLLRMLMKPYRRGVAAWEIPWRMEGSTYAGKDLAFFKTPKPIPGRRLMMITDPLSPDLGKIAITSVEYPQGRPLSDFPEGSILFGEDADAEEGYYDLSGADRACLGWWLAKTYTQTFWAQFNETFGEDSRVAFVPENMGTDERRKIERWLKFLGRNMYGIFDEDVELTLLSANKTGTVNTYERFIEMANEEMTIAVLGQLQTTDGGDKGAYAKAAVQWRVQRDIVHMICAMEEDLLYDLALQFCRFNISEDFDPEDLPGVKPIPPRSEDRQTLATFFQTATNFLDVPTRQIREELEIEEPIDNEETIGPSSRAAQGDSQAVGTDSEGSDSSKRPTEDRKPRSQGEQEPD